jgi:pimeloyl-ACP methyl ester carboxylesterase
MVRWNILDVMGVPTRYLSGGNGPSMLFLHGIGNSALDWKWLIAELSHEFTVYAPDLPGTTQFENGSDYSFDSITRFVIAFLDLLNIRKTIVIGNSLGGLVGLNFALTYSERVNALGLLSSAGLGKTINPIMSLLSLPSAYNAAIVWGRTQWGALQRAYLRTLLLFEKPQRAPSQWWFEQYRLARSQSFLSTTTKSLQSQVDLTGQRCILLNELSHLQIPVMVAWGRQDRILPVAHAQRAVRRLDRGQLQIIEDCGHLPHIERPTQLATAMHDFLNR